MVTTQIVVDRFHVAKHYREYSRKSTQSRNEATQANIAGIGVYLINRRQVGFSEKPWENPAKE